MLSETHTDLHRNNTAVFKLSSGWGYFWFLNVQSKSWSSLFVNLSDFVLDLFLIQSLPKR